MSIKGDYKELIFLIVFSLLFHAADAQIENSLQGHFPPPDKPVSVYALKATSQVLIDGSLNERDWEVAIPLTNFMQIEPKQGEPLKYPTIVKILFDERFIYIGAYCKDPAGKKGIRVQDFSRDFDYFENDLFAIALDPFNEKQNASVFQTNPYGALGDLQVVNGVIDREWDARWTARTSISESGWNCEMAIPWKTLRYPNSNVDSLAWGISFNRIARRDNENSAFPGYPRSFADTYRMDYVAQLKGIAPPAPSTNIQINPYSVNRWNTRKVAGTKAGQDLSSKIGGEIKWSPTASSTVDFTVNTDFAQAEADRAVNNLDRFTVFFPERRQFFLENAGLFDAGNSASFKPFHSRTIGLNKEGNPIQIDAGIRYTEKHSKYSLGALYIHQANSSTIQAANISVGRFIKNYGEQNNIGFLLTNRIDQANDSLKSNINTTASITGFNQFNDKLNFKYTLSSSKTDGNYKDNGTAAATSLKYSANNFALEWNFSMVSAQYNSQAGYIRRRDFFKNFADIYLIKRKQKWLPGFVRSWQPGFSIDEFQSLKDWSLQEARFTFSPLVFVFNSGAKFSMGYTLNWQNLKADFEPLGIRIIKGQYQYNRIELDYNSDQSSKFSWASSLSIGGYYNGKISTYTGSLRYAPVPYFAANIDYDMYKLKQVGIDKENITTHLITPNVRMALNPRVQLNIFYQANTATNQSSWNSRFSWEYKPSSFIYLLWNQNNNDSLQQGQSIAKISYLKQF